MNMANDVMINDMEKDAIGEIMNISMGSAATALSSMFDRKVLITTPRVIDADLGAKPYNGLTPSLLVSITYSDGLTGDNVIIFKQSDIQLLLNALMGFDTLSEDFEFDEISISAACEVMNQMMGASATALSNFLGRTINISPPQAKVIDSSTNIVELMKENGKYDNSISVFFDLSIEGMLESEFASILSVDLAKELVKSVMGGVDQATEIEATQEAPAQPEVHQQPQQQQANQMQNGQMPPQMSPGQQQMPPMNGMPPMGYTADGYPMPPYGYPPQMPYGYPGQQMPYGYPPQGGMPQAQTQAQPTVRQCIDVKPVQMPDFSNQVATGVPLGEDGSNINLIMNVPLSISVELGKTKKKIRDIMDFSQGTVLELEKQAGAPVDVVVNGQLIARGDVVVIEDNFGVRITEILGTKEILNSLENKK